MSIVLGSDYKYNEKACKKPRYKRNIHTSSVLKQIKETLEDLKFKVLRPVKNDMPFCNSLWTRDSFINIDNKLVMLPLLKRHPAEWLSIPAAYNRREIFPSYPENLEGGDVIQDGNTILVGIGKRTNEKGVEQLKSMFPKKKIIEIKHSGLHLDCCLMVLPGKKILYSKRYIKKLPKYLLDNYDCKTVESIIGDDVDPALATNGLLIGHNIITTDQPKFKKFRDYLRKLGYNVIEIRYGNLWRDDGGIRCLTQWFEKPPNQLIS